MNSYIDHFFYFFPAVITYSAIFNRVFLTEIIQKRNPAASIRLTKTDQSIEMNVGDPLFFLFFLINKIFDLGDVTVTEEQQTMRLQTIASGSPDLLIIAFDVTGKIEMNDKADIRFIDSHPKSDGCHDYLHIISDEKFLVLLSFCIGKSSVIRFYGKSFFI